jgi:uncharacterized membrane protein YedE/YeeE
VSDRLVGLLFGAAFGFLLGWAQLSDPSVIHRMLRLQEPDVFLIMGSAVATAAIGLRLLRALGAKTLLGQAPVAWNVSRIERKHLVGSAIFGLGWSIACTCPGPLAVQLGRGQLLGLFTAGGLFVGIAAAQAWLRRGSRPEATPAPTTETVGL